MGEVAIPEVKQPRFVIDAFRHMKKHSEVLSSKVEFAFTTLKVKTQFGCEFSFGILSPVSAALVAWLGRGECERRLIRSPKPPQGFSWIECFRHRVRSLTSRTPAENLDHFPRLISNRNDEINDG